jgi:UDP-N-acetylglucosamine:LPS N-acetylglucosamine transferase
VRVAWAHHPTTRNIPNLVRNAGLAFRLLRKAKPSVIVSTGAGVAVPFFVLGWLRGIPTVYLEVYDRVDSPTLTGRLCRPFTRLFLVQWEEQRKFYPGSVVVGPLL